MASAMTHVIVAAALAAPASESGILRRVLPRFWGHRGFFHSPFFLILFSALPAAIIARRFGRAVIARLALIWACAAITRPLLDLLTDGGAGVMLLFPFSEAPLFFPWRPIHVSPLEISRFLSVAGYILRSELPFCIVAAAVGTAGWIAVRARTAGHAPDIRAGDFRSQ